MKVCVFGLWHLGSVTAACLAEHFPTVGWDPLPATTAGLNAGEPPLFEPGLAELVQAGIARGALTFTSDLPQAVSESDIVWVAFDTPVDEEDRADVAWVEGQIASAFRYLKADALVIVSSQVPVGTCARLEASFRAQYPQSQATFACLPENLRLGKALKVFREPERIVAGIRSARDREKLTGLLKPFCSKIVWMTVESAEMTKHAINAFLATSVTFINEIASVCEAVGADAKEVEQGLKTDERIGPRAYLGAGGAFAGGTLARDIAFLIAKSREESLTTPLFSAIRQSNDAHKTWPGRKLASLLGNFAGKTVCVLGLTYKPGTNSLRRSSSVELCQWLAGQGAAVRAFDPAVSALPPELTSVITLCTSAAHALEGSDALVIATPWPEFRNLTAAEVTQKMNKPLVLDADRFLDKTLGSIPGVRYVTVGKPAHAA